MPLLGRKNAPRLLGKVAGKPHASSDDHDYEDHERVGTVARYTADKENICSERAENSGPSLRHPQIEKRKATIEVIDLEGSPSPVKKQKIRRSNGKRDPSALEVIDSAGTSRPAEQRAETMRCNRPPGRRAESSLPSPEQKESGRSPPTVIIDDDDVYAEPKSSSELDESEKLQEVLEKSSTSRSASQKRSVKRRNLDEGNNPRASRAKTQQTHISSKSSLGQGDVDADAKGSSKVDEATKEEKAQTRTARNKSESNSFKRLSLGMFEEGCSRGKIAKTQQSFASPKRSLVDDDLGAEESKEEEEFFNIHAASKNGEKTVAMRKAGYGLQAKRDAERREKKKQKTFTKLHLESKSVEPEAPSITFKSMKSLSSVTNENSSQSMAAYSDSLNTAGAEVDSDLPQPETSQLADLSDDDGEEGDVLEGQSRIKCSFCREWVLKSTREDFEDTILQDRDASYKWERRFCHWHKQRTAKCLWHQRGYPVIDWSNLGSRMRKYDTIIRKVVEGSVDSHYVRLMHELDKQGHDNVRANIGGGNNNVNTSAGYYGPKGEKIMTEHIIDRLSDRLRERSLNDKLVASYGLQGGVSGFVHIVLAPHLAEHLIKEDMNLTGSGWETQARAIMAESAELGELLNPEDGPRDEDKMNVIELDENED